MVRRTLLAVLAAFVAAGTAHAHRLESFRLPPGATDLQSRVEADAHGLPMRATTTASVACRQSNTLFLRYGVSNISASGVSCRRAVRTITRWARARTPGKGPKGWRCSSRRRAGFERVSCRRSTARMRFDLGGG